MEKNTKEMSTRPQFEEYDMRRLDRNAVKGLELIRSHAAVYDLWMNEMKGSLERIRMGYLFEGLADLYDFGLMQGYRMALNDIKKGRVKA